MKKTIFPALLALATAAALPILALAAPASAQPTQASATAACSTAPDIDAFTYSDPSNGNHGVEADIDSNPCGFAVQAAATCISSHSPYDESNVYGTSVYDNGAKSYASCGTSAGIVHGGWRYKDGGTWVYHTYVVS